MTTTISQVFESTNPSCLKIANTKRYGGRMVMSILRIVNHTESP
jgi:hypothetical protein